MPLWVGYAAMGTGLVPLTALVWLRGRGERRGATWWWLAVAFAVSFLADVAGMVGYGTLASSTYPLLQAGLCAWVLLPRAQATRATLLLAFAAGVSLAIRMAEGPEAVRKGLDLVLHVVGWHMVALAAWGRVPDGWLRITLSVGFAALSWVWVAFVLVRALPDPSPALVEFWWYAVQAVRLAMAVGFVYAVRTEGR